MNRVRHCEKKVIFCAMLSISLLFFSSVLFADEELDRYIAQLGSKSRSEWDQAAEKLLFSGKKAVPLLIKALDAAPDEQKIAIVRVLLELKASEAVPKIITLLKSENKGLRMLSAYALGKIHDARALEPLLKMLETARDEDSRGATIFGLGFLGNSKAVPVLKNELKNDSQRIRIWAASALGLLSNAAGFDEALTGTYSENTNIRLSAVEALGVIGDKRAEPRLKEMIDDPRLGWKSEAILSLKQIEVRNLPDGQKLSALKQCLFGPNERIVEWAIQSLADMGTPEALFLLEEKAKDGRKNRESYLAMRSLKAARGR